MNKALLLTGALLAGCGPSAPQAKQAPAAKVLEEAPMRWQGQFCEVGEPKTRWVDNAEGWEMTWKMIGAPPPPVDLEKYFAVAVFLGEKNTGGYGVEFLEPAEDAAAGTWTVRYKETQPAGFAIQALTRPYAVKLFLRAPAGRLKVKVELAR